MITRYLDLALSIYTTGLLVYVISSWVQHAQVDKARVWLGKFYEPVLVKIRGVIRPVRIGSAMIDFSALVLLMGLHLLKGIVAGSVQR